MFKNVPRIQIEEAFHRVFWGLMKDFFLNKKKNKKNKK